MTTTTQEMDTNFEVAQHHQSLQSRCDGPVSPIRLMFSTFFENELSRHCFYPVKPMHAYTVECSRDSKQKKKKRKNQKTPSPN